MPREESDTEEHAPPPPPLTMVDCDVLEAAKENVQPLGRGRRVTALSTILATPHVQRDAKLVRMRMRLRADVERALESVSVCESVCEGEGESGSGFRDDPGDGGVDGDGDGEGDADADRDGSTAHAHTHAHAPDALEAYTRLVSWTIENYPQGPSVDSGLLELLEEATRVLLPLRSRRRGGAYKAEMGYLKLWLLYAGFVERPTMVYRFLVKNEIGTRFALLYEECAAVLERDGRRKEADEAYVLGIARRAEPLEHLVARHVEFQKRMMANVGVVGPAPSRSTTTRLVLAPSSSTSAAAAASSSSTSARGIVEGAVRGPSTSTNAALRIFVDPTGSESRASMTTTENAWTDIGTRKTRVKENVQETKKLVGTTVRRTGTKRVTSGSASAGRIPVFRDPPDALPRGDEVVPADQLEEAEDPVCVKRFVPFRDEEVGTPALVGDKSVMRPGGSVSEMEALRKDPLKNYRGDGLFS